MRFWSREMMYFGKPRLIAWSCAAMLIIAGGIFAAQLPGILPNAFALGSHQPASGPGFTGSVSPPPSTMAVGESFRLRFHISDLTGSGDHGGISVSFPTLTQRSTSDISYSSNQGSVRTYSYTTGSVNVKYYDIEDTLNTAQGSQKPAEHLLVESDDSTWPARSSRTLVLEVTPNQVGSFRVYYRFWICADGYSDCTRSPSGFDIQGLDQQGWGARFFTIQVTDPPRITRMGCSPTTVALGETVSCRPTLRGGEPTRYTWGAVGGDPWTGTGPNFSTKWARPGDKRIVLRVCNDDDCHIAEQSIVVEAPPAPEIVAMGCSPTTVALGETVSCRPTLRGGEPTSYTWGAVGGDPWTGTGPNFSTKWARPGDKRIVLRACNNGSCHSAEQSIVVEAPPAQTASPAPANVEVANGSGAGEAVVTWDAAEAAAYYRVGWALSSGYTDVDDLAEGSLDALTFVEIANRGQTSYAISGLLPGEKYYFVVGSKDERYGPVEWATGWAALTLTADPTFDPLFDSGVAKITWTKSEGPTYLRIGWVARDDYEAIRSESDDWLDGLKFVDILNLGQSTHDIGSLRPGTEYYYLVGGNDTRHGQPQWPSGFTSVTALSGWKTVSFVPNVGDGCNNQLINKISLPLSQDSSEDVVPYLCRDDNGENYWIFVPEAYTDPDAVVEQLHGRAFDELGEVDNRVEAYRSLIVEVASQKAFGERAHLSVFFDFNEGSRGPITAADEIIGDVIDAYALGYQEDSQQYRDLENHLRYLLEHSDIYDDRPFGSIEFDAAIMAAVSRTIFIDQTREHVRLLEQLPMDSAWPKAIEEAQEILNRKSSGDDLTEWGEFLEKYHDEIVLGLHVVAEVGAHVAAPAIGTALGIASLPVAVTLAAVAVVGFQVYERIHETNEFWDDLTLATVAAQAYWHTHRNRRDDGALTSAARRALLGYTEFSFYQHLYLAADNPLTGASLIGIGNLGETNPSEFVQTLLERRDLVLDRLIDSAWEPTRDFKPLYDATGLPSLSGLIEPTGMWSDGDTMWVSEDTGTTLRAFDMETKLWVEELDFDTARPYEGISFTDIWSDEETMWIAARLLLNQGSTSGGLYAYEVTSQQDDATQSLYTLAGRNHLPWGVWSNGTTIWVSNTAVSKIYAYDLATRQRDSAKDFDGLRLAGNDSPHGIWSNEKTMWVADREDDKVYAYDLATARRDPTREFNLVNVPGVVTNTEPGGIWSDGTSMWVIDGAERKIFAYDLPEAPASVAAFPFGRDPAGDLSRLNATENHHAEGIWSDGTTMWVADHDDDHVYAYRLSDGARVEDEEFDLYSRLLFEGNHHARGIWSDGTTMWVADHDDDRIYAYRLSDGARVEELEFGDEVLKAAGNADATGIWFDATTLTMWVADRSDNLIYGYDQETKTLVRTIDTLKAAGNHDAEGIWSNGTTMWVADHDDDRVYAYRLSDGARVEDLEFDTPSAAGNQDMKGIWSDGTTMWVADQDKDWVYAYHMPPLAAALPLGNPTNLTAAPGSQTGEVALSWSPAANATVHWVYLVKPDGTDGRYWPHAQAGDTARLTVTGLDAGETYLFLVIAGQEQADGTTLWSQWSNWGQAIPAGGPPPMLSEEPFARNEAQDFNGLAADHIRGEEGIWSDGVTMWVADTVSDQLFAYDLVSKDRVPARDFDTLSAAGNRAPEGIWSNGITMWVADDSDKIFAYGLHTKARTPALDFNFLGSAGNHAPEGIWSDGTTMWVADDVDNRLYAYDMNTKARAPSRDFNTLDAAGNRYPIAIWSDGATMWVSDWDDDKLYAYNLSTKMRTPALDFNTLDAAGNNAPEGIWSDGTTMWVRDDADNKIYAYNMPAAAAIPILGNPANLAAVPGAPSGEVELNWTPAANATIHQVYLQKTDGTGGREWPHALFGDADGATITGLEVGQTYRFRVRASQEQADGTTEWSEWSNWAEAMPGGEEMATVGQVSSNPISGGRWHTCGLRADGTAVCWGANLDGQATPPAGVAFAAISSGGRHTCGLRVDGAPVCWGWDEHGQATPPPGQTFTAISSGLRHTCGLRADGTVVCWGLDLDGQATPPAGQSFAAISSGRWHTCGLRSNGTVVCWGANRDGQSTPPTGETFAIISSGGDRTCGLQANGTAVCWGDDRHDQSTPPTGETLIAISGGGEHTCGLRSNGAAVCWGDNGHGQSTPPFGEAYATIASGESHTCGLRADGTVVCWGLDLDGQATPPAELKADVDPGTGDRAALVEFYNATNGADWTNNANWLGDVPIGQWRGVETDGSGRVTKLDLSGNRLVGPIPPGLARLTSLVELTLSNNRLNGRIPEKLAGLSNLSGLHLEANELHGPIPAELGQLSELDTLYLGGNSLSGTIPAELGNLSNLVGLGLRNNRLTGTIPPELGSLSRLAYLYLGQNMLSGEIPSELGNLNNLMHAYLAGGGNHFTGCVPVGLRDVPDNDINELGLPFCGDPAINLASEREVLTALYTATNGANWENNTNWLTDAPLGEWHGVATDEEGRVIRINLAQNGLTGPIPAELGRLSNLVELSLWDNGLTGTLPSELANLSNLKWFAVGGNELRGPIPAWLGNLTNLYDLHLVDNQFTGAIPQELSRLTNLGRLNLGRNSLTGSIPTWLGGMTSLERLMLFENQLTGPIPEELGNLANLRELWLYRNRLTGEIPAELAGLANLGELRLEYNQLTGTIPATLGDLSNLTYLHLSGNELAGTIPTQLQHLGSLEHLYLWENELTGPVPEWLGDLANLERMSLSRNELTGTIPVQLENLSKLRLLNLGGNELTGTIPAQLRNLDAMEEFNLWDNELSGPIPPWLGSLSNMIMLRLQGNQLTGSIPAALGNLSQLTLLELANNQ